MNDAEKLQEYEKIVKKKKRKEWFDEIWSLVLGVFALTTMCVIYVYFGYRAFDSLVIPYATYLVATAMTLVIIVFASATCRAFQTVFKKKKGE